MTSPTAHRLVLVGAGSSTAAPAEMFDDWAEALGLPDWELSVPPISARPGPAECAALLDTAGADELARGMVIVGAVRGAVYAACRPSLRPGHDAVDRFRDVSCLVRGDGGWLAYSLDALAIGHVLARIAGTQYWAGAREADALCLGAGTAAQVVCASLLTTSPGPRRVIVTDASEGRLAELAAAVTGAAAGRLTTVHAGRRADNDALVAGLPEASLVVNAAGVGDSVGSPLTESVRLPLRGVFWELSSRGSFDVLDLAREQADDLLLRVHDGWELYLEGWAQALRLITGADASAAQLAEASG